MALVAENLPANAGDKRCVQPLGRNVPAIPWREGMAIHSSILAWRSPGPEEPGRLLPWACKESDMTEAT